MRLLPSKIFKRRIPLKVFIAVYDHHGRLLKSFSLEKDSNFTNIAHTLQMEYLPDKTNKVLAIVSVKNKNEPVRVFDIVPLIIEQELSKVAGFLEALTLIYEDTSEFPSISYSTLNYSESSYFVNLSTFIKYMNILEESGVGLIVVRHNDYRYQVFRCIKGSFERPRETMIEDFKRYLK